MLDPEEGRRLPLRGRDKGFSKVLVRPAPPATAQRPRRFPHQPGPSRRGARSQHTAAARPAAPDTASCSLGCADQPLPRPSSRCALPTMQLPWLPRPIRALAYPEMGPRRQPSSPPRAPSSSLPLPSPRAPGLQPHRSRVLGPLPRPQEGVGQVSRLRAASAPGATVSAPSTLTPRNPSLAPSPMLSLRQPRSLHPLRAAGGKSRGAAASRDTM